MTAGTTAEAPDDAGHADDRRIRLATAELLALVSMRRNAATDRARVLLGLSGDGLDSPVTAAGVGSLLIRRMARVTAGHLALRGAAHEIASVLANATEWIEAIGTTGNASHVAAVVRSPARTVLFEPGPYGVWGIWPVSQDDPLPETGARFVAAAFGSLSPSRRFTGSVRVIAEDDTTRTAVATTDGDGSWYLAAGRGGSIPAAGPTVPDPTFRVLAANLA